MSKCEMPCGHAFEGSEIDGILERLIVWEVKRRNHTPDYSNEGLAAAHSMIEARLKGALVRLSSRGTR